MADASSDSSLFLRGRISQEAIALFPYTCRNQKEADPQQLKKQLHQLYTHHSCRQVILNNQNTD
ncbi:MAG: hypothetical protein HFG25_06980 [Lachnospiraceae bacterium]|nr:hypothetical protein [Lachnospiraceae bacterium]